MPTIGELKTKISLDLHRTDQTSQVSDAVTNAIRRYSRERFWFLETTATLTLASSQKSYPLPADFKELDSIKVNVAGYTSPLDQVNYTELDRYDAGIGSGSPTVFAIYGDTIRFYPTPDSAYQTTVSYHRGIEDISDGASSVWSTTAYDLVRYAAEKELYATVLRNPDMAVIAGQMEQEAFNSLVRENIGRISTGRLVKSGF